VSQKPLLISSQHWSHIKEHKRRQKVVFQSLVFLPDIYLTEYSNCSLHFIQDLYIHSEINTGCSVVMISYLGVQPCPPHAVSESARTRSFPWQILAPNFSFFPFPYWKASGTLLIVIFFLILPDFLKMFLEKTSED
jgi:hypothetical protein